MEVNAAKIGIAAAIAVAVVWVICSLLVLAFPVSMMGISGHMVHGDLSGMAWDMSFGGVITGLVIWSVVVGITAWFGAAIYNRMD